MNITILGAGAFGLALATAFFENGNSICIWSKFEEEIQLLKEKRCYEKVLPGVMIPLDIFLTTDMKEALRESEIVVLCVPACFTNDVLLEMKKYVKGNEHFVIASKGMDSSKLFLDELLKKHVVTDKVAVLSGPTFAIDMAKKYPVAFTVASHHKETEKVIFDTLESHFVSISSFDDVLAIEICGAVKNIMAIGAGILAGMDMPVSTQSFYLTKVLSDMEKVISCFGSDKRAVLSYAGIGDLFLTCTSQKSRNFQLGYFIGSGASLDKIKQYEKETTVEGLDTLNIFYHLMKEKKVDIPIFHLLYDILFLGKEKELFYDFLDEKKTVL